MADEFNLQFWPTGDGMDFVGLGNRPAPEGFVVPCVGKVQPLPQSEWQEFTLVSANDSAQPKVKNQGSTSSCNGHAASETAEWARWIAGLPSVTLSPFYCYAGICGGVDAGSSIAEALTWMKKEGTCRNDLVPFGTFRFKYITDAAKQDAVNYRIEIGEPVNTFDEMMACCQRREVINGSVAVNTGFNRLDADGVPQNSPGIHNHAILIGLGAKRTRSGEWAILCQNSWGVQWGQNGYFWATEKTFRGSFSDNYVVRAVITDNASMPPKIA